MSVITDLGIGTAAAAVGMVDTMQTISPNMDEVSAWPFIYAIAALIVKEVGVVALAYIRAKYKGGGSDK